MQFNSIIFFIFLPTVLLLTHLASHKFQWFILLSASYFFYGWWRADFLLLIIFSTLIDYVCAICMEEFSTKKKIFLGISLGLNVSLLGIFKYGDFGINNLNSIFGFLNSDFRVENLDWILPVGISFYTFQTLSYTIDVYRGNLSAERHLGRFALYVVYFPQLIAGPIERATNLIPQLKLSLNITWPSITSGARLFIWGLFKKIVLGDRAAMIVDEIYNRPASAKGVVIVFAAVAFSIQIYADFSGYCDMARGCSRMFGIELMENFRMPYLAKSFKDFWTRWHISLSTWFRDYLYIPLGGNRVNSSRKILNLWVVFLVSGLWHGANWTFLTWGALHGTMLSLEGICSKTKKFSFLSHAIFNFPKTVLTFVLVCLFWIPFRSPNIHSALLFLRNIFTPPFFNQSVKINDYEIFLTFIFSLLVIIVDSQRKVWMYKILAMSLPIRWALYYTILGCCYFYGMRSTNTFIYFQF